MKLLYWERKIFSFFLIFCFSLTNSDLSRWQGAHLMPFWVSLQSQEKTVAQQIFLFLWLPSDGYSQSMWCLRKQNLATQNQFNIHKRTALYLAPSLWTFVFFALEIKCSKVVFSFMQNRMDLCPDRCALAYRWAHHESLVSYQNTSDTTMEVNSQMHYSEKIYSKFQLEMPRTAFPAAAQAAKLGISLLPLSPHGWGRLSTRGHLYGRHIYTLGTACRGRKRNNFCD